MVVWGSRSCDWLIARTGATPEVSGVAIEMTQGPVGEALLERGFCVYGIHPKQLDRFRDRFTVGGAKDDRRDAHVLADSLRTDRHAFRRLSNDEPVIVKLREWSRMADDLQQKRTRLASRMREQLWRYYLQMLELADDLAADWFLDLWNQAPSPTKPARLRQTTIERFVEADIGRYKRVIGDALCSRTKARQTTEVAIAVSSLNSML